MTTPEPYVGRPLCCGRTFLAAGLVDEAKKEARRMLDALSLTVVAGVPIVGLEPACLLTLRDEIPKSAPGLLGGLLIRPGVRRIRERMDWREFGGAPLLGIDGVAIVAHGRSDAQALKSAIRVARDSVENGLVANIREAVG